MPNNNPGGENGYLSYGVESPYGAQKRMEESTKAAPIGPTPGGNAPKQAQRRAVSGQTGPESPAEPPVEEQLVQTPPPPAAVWAEVAAIPGISPLVAEYALDA